MRSALRYPGYDGYFQNEVAGTTWTQAVKLREPASATRLVVVAVARISGAAATDTSCSVFGTALTQNVTHASSTAGLSLYSGYVTTGQSGDVVTVISSTSSRWAMAVFSFLRASATPAATYTDAAGALDAALALTAGAIAILGVSCVNNEMPRPSWVGVKPIIVKKVFSNLAFSVAMHSSRIAETRNAQAFWDYGQANPRLVGGIWA